MVTQNTYNQGYNQAPQQGYNQAPQQGYNQAPPQGGNYQQGGQQQGGQQQRQNSGFDNMIQVQALGRIVKDPESKVIGTSVVASAKVAINHRSEKAGTDFWFIEAWGTENSKRLHNFLVNHCGKGRKVLITGTPELRQTQKEVNGRTEYSYYPTIKLTDIIGVESSGENSNGAGGQQQQQQQPPNGQYGQAPQQQQQYNQAPPQQQQQPYNQAPPQQPYNQAPPVGAPPMGAPGTFPPNPPGGGYGAPVGPPAGAPNGGFPAR